MPNLENRQILLVISGGIAAYKALELIRLLKRAGAGVRCLMTAGSQKFITPLSAAALSGNEVYTDLWSLKDETEMGHIRLAREADLIVIAPASANLLAKLAQGIADDLASTTLLAADKTILAAPAMNPEMWGSPATQANIDTLRRNGVLMTGPDSGDTACGETGTGRMAEPEAILADIARFFELAGRLKGRRALVTSGPTYEPLDPVRFISNRSSGKQGHAIAAALAQAGADVTLVTGPVALPDPPGVRAIHVATAQQMLDACLAALPADIAVCAAAVCDWAPAALSAQKMKKRSGGSLPRLELAETPDILKAIAASAARPRLVVGFAAETERLLEHAAAKRLEKGCEWVMANDVGAGNVFGGDANHVYLVTETGAQEWPQAAKKEIAARLAQEISDFMETGKHVRQAAE